MLIYKVEHIDTGKTYVGKSKKSPTSFKSYYGSGTIIKAAVKKHGKEKFIKTILEVCDNDEQLNQQEKYWIDKLNCMYPIGYNIHEGGLGGDSFYHLTEEEKKVIFERRLRNNPDMYDKIRDIRIKNGSYIYTEERLQKCIEGNRRRAQNPLTKEKHRQSNLTNSPTEKIYTIQIISTNEIVELKNMRAVKEFVTNYNIKNKLSYRQRSNYWKLLFSNETNNMKLLDKKRVRS